MPVTLSQMFNDLCNGQANNHKDQNRSADI